MNFVGSGAPLAAFGKFGLRNCEYHPIWLDCRKSVHILRISGIAIRNTSRRNYSARTKKDVATTERSSTNSSPTGKSSLTKANCHVKIIPPHNQVLLKLLTLNQAKFQLLSP